MISDKFFMLGNNVNVMMFASFAIEVNIHIIQVVLLETLRLQ